MYVSGKKKKQIVRRLKVKVIVMKGQCYKQLVTTAESEVPIMWRKCSSLKFADFIIKQLKSCSTKEEGKALLSSGKILVQRLCSLLTLLYEATKYTWTHMQSMLHTPPLQLDVTVQKLSNMFSKKHFLCGP